MAAPVRSRTARESGGTARGGARPDLLGLPPFATTMAATSLSLWTSQTPGNCSTAVGVRRRAVVEPAELRVLLSATTAMEAQRVALASVFAANAAGALEGAGTVLRAKGLGRLQQQTVALQAGALLSLEATTTLVAERAAQSFRATPGKATRAWYKLHQASLQLRQATTLAGVPFLGPLLLLQRRAVAGPRATRTRGKAGGRRARLARAPTRGLAKAKAKTTASGRQQEPTQVVRMGAVGEAAAGVAIASRGEGSASGDL